MTTKHTAGPWHYTLNVGPTRALIAEADGSTIVELSTNVRDSRLAANARLIAAAPLLLAEAKELLRKATYADGTAQVLTQDCEALEAAIAKAEGGES